MAPSRGDGAASNDSASIASEVLRAAREGPSVAVATVVAAPEGLPGLGAKLLVRADGSRLGAMPTPALEDAVAGDAVEALTRLPRQAVQAMYFRSEGSRIHRLEAEESGAYEVMVEVVEPPATLVVVGGGHIGLSLATIGAHVGFSVTVVDDRQMYANPERFPMADHVFAGDLTEVLRDLNIGTNTYVVLVSRGHKQDEVALRSVVGSKAAYVGMIGSRRRVATVLRHLAEEGFDVDALERVHTPIGIDIGAETPEEIAVSILAEVVLVRRGGSGRRMSEGRTPVRVAEREE